MLYNAQEWKGRILPEYGQDNIANIRKLMVSKWLNNYNNDVNWRRMLNIKKVQTIKQIFFLIQFII